ncbi:MAG: hypothetical protein DCC49_00560 [Acidobacteria bacterium]|nr:MAG: hypothetical protein DCC49_00560 [Acidobacteriota bacterium]
MTSVATALAVTLAWVILALAPQTRRWSDRQWAVAVIGVLALSYAGQALSMSIFYNGGQGDDRYQLAFVEVVSQGRIFDDYFNLGVEGHYPPLVFWLGGLIDWVTGSGAVTALRWLPLPVIVGTASLIAWTSAKTKSSPTLALIIALGMGSFLVSYLTTFGPTRGLWALLIVKPQQVLGGAMAVAFAVLPVAGRGMSRRSRILVGSALFAGIMLTIPLYLPIAASGGAAAILKRHRLGGDPGSSRKSFMELAVAMVAGIALTGFYWLPLLRAFADGNWQNNYIYWQSIDSLDPSRWTVGFAFGVPVVAGVLAIRRYDDPQTWALAGLSFVSGLIYASAYVTYPLFGISFLAWWAPIPASIALSILAARYLRDWLELRFSAGPIDISFRRARWPALMLVAALILPLANWNTLTDPQLERAHDAFNIDLVEGSRVLHEELDQNRTFVTGSDSLLLAGMSGRSLTVVPHAFYANPMARTGERRADVEALLADPNCSRTFEMVGRWKMGALVAEVIPVTGGAPVAGPAQGGQPARQTTENVAAKSLGISFLDPAKTFSPEKVGVTTYVPLSPKVNSEQCWRLAYLGDTLAIYLVNSPEG